MAEENKKTSSRKGKPCESPSTGAYIEAAEPQLLAEDRLVLEKEKSRRTELKQDRQSIPGAQRGQGKNAGLRRGRPARRGGKEKGPH